MTSSPSPLPDRFRVPGLDGIRALAVTTVIVFHLLPGTLVGGYLGVDIFFVVSGFLITTLLLRERAATGRIAWDGVPERTLRAPAGAPDSGPGGHVIRAARAP